MSPTVGHDFARPQQTCRSLVNARTCHWRWGEPGARIALRLVLVWIQAREGQPGGDPMARHIVIEFDFGPGGKPDVHRVRNFNDALYALAREDEWMSFSLDQLDKLTGQKVAVKSARRVRRVIAKVERLINDHEFTGIARASMKIS